MSKTDKFLVDSATFYISAADPKGLPQVQGRELCVMGRSNVGKSSLINMILQRKGLAKTSRTPGRTRMVNYFDVSMRRTGGQPQGFMVVDLPGYGFAKISKSEKARLKRLLDGYLVAEARASAALQLVDGRQGATENDQEVYSNLAAAGLPIVIAATKIDKIPKAKRVLVKNQISLTLNNAPVVLTSSLKLIGRDALWQALWPVLFGGPV